MAFEQHVEVLKRICPDARVIFDVGACTGAFSRQFLAHWPKARVYAFEPDARCIKRLRSIGDRRLVVVPKCVGASTGKAMYKAHPTDMSIGTIKKPFRPADEFEQIEVPLTFIDHFCETKRIGKVDIVKIDTQGAELDVLVGAGDVLDTVSVVVAELMFHEHCIEVSPWWKIPSVLHAHGLCLHWLFPVYRKIGGVERIGFADAVFARGTL